MSANERSGWRDVQLSIRHRKYGCDVPATDIDHLLIEYDCAQPTALIEHKHLLAGAVNLSHANYRATTELADRANLPFFVVRYNPERWTYRIQPANGIAQGVVFDPATCTEREYVEFLYRIRGREAPPELLAQLNDIRPAGGTL